MRENPLEKTLAGDATAAGVRLFEEKPPSAPLKPKVPKFIDYDLGITTQHPDVVMANRERRERIDRTKNSHVSSSSDQDGSTFAIHQPSNFSHGHGDICFASSSPQRTLPLTPTQRYRYSPVQTLAHKSTPTIFPKEPYPKPRKYRPPPLDEWQATKSAPRSMQAPETHETDRRIHPLQGSDGAAVSRLFGGEEEIHGPGQGSNRAAFLRSFGGEEEIHGPGQGSNRAAFPRSFVGKEAIQDGIVFLPNTSDKSLFPISTDRFSRSGKRNLNLPATARPKPSSSSRRSHLRSVSYIDTCQPGI